MKIRVKDYSDRNLIGRRVETLRKARGIKQKDFIARLQVAGLDINPTSYSKLEGQVRIATDREVYVIAQVLGVPMEELFEDGETTE
jgi:transcriptional regulator with XRE-family HTH domain